MEVDNEQEPNGSVGKEVGSNAPTNEVKDQNTNNGDEEEGSGTSSTVPKVHTKEDNSKENSALSDTESSVVTRTNGGPDSAGSKVTVGSLAKPVGKTPVTAMSLVETVAKLRKTISAVKFQPPGLISGPSTKKVVVDIENGNSSVLPNGGEREQPIQEASELVADDESSDDAEEEDAGDDDDEDDDDDDESQDENQEAQNDEIKKKSDETELGDDDDSLRTPDPSSLSKSVMNLVDPVVSDHEEKTKQQVAVVKETPAAPKVTSVQNSGGKPAPVAAITTRVLTPKEMDDQSTIISYSPVVKIFKCDARTCGIKTNKESVIKAHIEQHTGTQNIWYRCLYCKTITKNIENIRKHLQKFHVTDVLRFSKLNSPSVHEVYQSLIGEVKKDEVEKPTATDGAKEADAAEPLVVIDDGENEESNSNVEAEVTKKIPERRNSTGNPTSPAPVIRKGSTDAIKPGYTTRLECYYKEKFYRCKICGFKSENNETFAVHAYHHLHGADGKIGLANCGAADKSHGVTDCNVVKGMMNLLQQQKDGEINRAKSAAAKPQVQGKPGSQGQSLRTLLTKPATQLQNPGTATQGPPKRLVIVPAAAVKSPGTPKESSSSTPSPIIKHSSEPTTVFPPYTSKSPVKSAPTPSPTREKVFGPFGAQSSIKASESPKIEIPDVDMPVIEDESESDEAAEDDDDEPYVEVKHAGPTLVVTTENKICKQEDQPDPQQKPIYKCKFKDGAYICLACKYQCPAMKPDVFRKHLWKELHPKNKCGHCEPDVVFNMFRNCPILNGLMKLLEGEVIKSMEEAATETAKQKAAEVVDLDSENSQETKSSEKTNGDPEKTGEKKTDSGDISENSTGRDFSDVIDMIKGLNDSKGDTTSAKPGEDKKESATRESKVKEGIASPAKETTESSAAALKPIELDSDFSGEDEYEDDTGEEGLRFGIFQRKEIDVSRFMAYSRDANKSRDETRMCTSPGPAVAEALENKLYSCVFLKCLQWSSNSAESFTIHNLTQHSRTAVLPCSYCAGSFRDEHQLVDHINSSHKLGDNKLSRLYQCAVDQCYFATNYISEFKSHNTFEHSAASELKCIYCNAKFPSGEFLMKHLQENIMKLIQCPLCPLASQMKSVILNHISQTHPDHPKRIITTSYATCHQKLWKEDTEDSVVDGEKVGKVTRRSSTGTRQQNGELSDTESEKEKSQAATVSAGKKGQLGLSCNFVCGTCSTYTTTIQDDFHEHIMTCAKGKKSPKSSGASEVQEPQTIVIEPEAPPTPVKPQIQGTRERSRKSKPEKRVLNGSDMEEDDDEVPVREDVLIQDTTTEGEDDVTQPEVEQDMPSEEDKSGGIPQPGPEQKCGQCGYTTVYSDVLPLHEAMHGSRHPNKRKRNFMCFLCNFSADKMKVYKFHLWMHRTTQPDRYYSCYYCKTHSNQQDILERHIEETHKTLTFKYEVIKESVGKLECLYCSKIAHTATEEELLQHVQSTHGSQRVLRYLYDVYELNLGLAQPELITDDSDIITTNVNIPMEQENSQEDGPQRPIRAVRSRQNTIEEMLSQNENSAEGEAAIKKAFYPGMQDRFQCPYCNFTCDDMYTWKKHMQKYVGFGAQEFPVFRCVKCKWTSTDQQRVIDHALGKHTLGMGLSEDDIAVSDTVEVQGTGQTTVVSGGGSIERYHCDHCEFGSNQIQALVKHMNEAHSGDNPEEPAEGLEEIAEAGDEIGFDDDPSDDYAPSSAGRRSSGENHGVTTLGIGAGGLKTKFYRCETCPYVNADKRLFVKHRKSHERQANIVSGVQCGFCQFRALKPHTVKIHSIKYHPNKLYKVVTYPEGRPVPGWYHDDNTVEGEDKSPVSVNQSKMADGFQCGFCGHTASKPHLIKMHNNRVHPNKRFKVVTYPEGRPVPGWYNKEAGEAEPDEADQAFPLTPVKGKAPLQVIKDLTENARQAVPALPPALNKLVSTPTEAASIPEDMIFKVPQKCPHCDFTTKVRYNLVRHLQSHQESKESSPLQVNNEGSNNSTENQEINSDLYSASSLDDDSDSSLSGDEVDVNGTGDEPAAKKQKTDENFEVYAVKIPGKELYQCNKCVFMDKVPSKVMKHFCSRHANDCPYQCGYCSYVSVTTGKIHRHCDKEHAGQEVKILSRRDPKTKITFSENQSLNNGPVTSRLPLKPAPITNTSQQHKTTTEGLAEFSDEFEEKLQSYVDPDPSDPRHFYCKLCGHEQEAMSAMMRHILSVHLAFYPFKCKYCFFAAVELDKTEKHVLRSHPDQEKVVKRRKFFGEWPKLIDGTIPFETNTKETSEAPSTPKVAKATMVKSKSPLSSQLPAISHALNSRPILPKPTTQDKPRMLVSLLTKAKVSARPGGQTSLLAPKVAPVPVVIAPQEDNDDVVVKSEPVDAYWDAQQTNPGSGNWAWHSPQTNAPSRDSTPQRATPDTSGSALNQSQTEDQDKSTEKKKLLYNCLYCGYQSKWAVKDVKIHLCAVHMRKYPYKCKHCPYTNRMKNNIFKHIRQEHPGMGLDFEDLIKEIDSMIAVKEDADTGMVYVGAYNDEGSLWEVEKANAYRPDVIGGWQESEFQKLTEMQMNRTQSLGTKSKPSVVNKQRVELIVPKPFDAYRIPGTSPSKQANLGSSMSSMGQSSTIVSEDYPSGSKDQVICHRCRVCDYRHGHLMKVYLHYLGVHLRKKPYVCGHCGFSQYTRHIVEKHHRTEHPRQQQHIRYLIPELKDEMKPYIVKVIRSRNMSQEGLQNSDNNLGGSLNSQSNSTTLVISSTGINFSQNTLGQTPRGQISVFPGPLSGDTGGSARPSPEKSLGTSRSSDAGTPPMGKTGRKGLGKLESAIQRLAQNALNNATRNTPSPTPVERNSFSENNPDLSGTESDSPMKVISAEITEDLSTPGQHKCDLCPFVGKTFRILKHHRRTHFSYRPYGCKYCALKSFYIASIRSHCEVKHPGKPSTYLQFEKPSILELSADDRRLDKSLTEQNETNGQNTDSEKNEEDSSSIFSAKALPPLSKEDMALAEQLQLLGGSHDDMTSQPGSSSGPVICPLCPHFLPSSLELRKHLNSSHPGYGPYKCGYCDNVQKYKKGMRGHLSTRHPSMQAKFTLVDPSGSQTNTTTTVDAESSTEAKLKPEEDMDEESSTPFLSEGAEEIAIDTSDMIEYVEDKMSEGDENDDDELKKNLADASSLYSCKHCNFVTKQGGAIRHHVMAHLSYCPYKCGHCGRSSVKSYPIKLHIQRQHPGKPENIISNRDEELEATLNTHYVKHAVKNQSLNAVKSSVEVSSLGTWRGKRKQFESSVQKSPGADSSSDREKLMNEGAASGNEDTTEDNNLVIDEFPDVVGKSPELLQYEKTLGNRKVYYKCALCGFKCDNNTSIRRHLMWETMYKPYCCSLCKRTDILAAAMRKHIRDKHPNGTGRVILKKNTQKEQRLISLVNHSRLYTDKYKPPMPIRPITPPVSPAPAVGTEDPGQPEPMEEESSVPDQQQQQQQPQDPQAPLMPKKLAGGLVKCPSCPKIMKMKLYRKHMVFHGGHRVKCDICDKTFYYPSDVLKHHGSAHRNLGTPYQWSKLATPVKPPNNKNYTPPNTSNSSSGLLKVKIAFKKDSPPEIVPAPPQQGVAGPGTGNPGSKAPTSAMRHPNLVTTEVMAYVQETDPDNPMSPHSKLASGTPMIDGLMLSAELFKKKGSGRLHCPHCSYATSNREHLKIHYIRHVPPRWKCKYCETKGQLSYELRKHVKARHPEKPLTMIKLNLDFTLARENQGDSPLGPDVKGKPSPVSIETPEVNVESDEPGSDEPEVESGSPEESQEEKPTKGVDLNTLHYNCCHCSFTAKSLVEFAQHMQQKHEPGSPVKSPGSSKAPASPIHTDDDESEQFVTVTPVYGNTRPSTEEETPGVETDEGCIHKCTLCVYQTNDIDAFEMHSRTHLPYRCGHCTYSAYQRNKIKKHHTSRHAGEGLALMIMEQNPTKPADSKKPAAASAAPKPNEQPKALRPYKPCPKSKKELYMPDPNAADDTISPEPEVMDSESDDDDDGDVGFTYSPGHDYANDKTYQPFLGLLDVRTLPDELLVLLLSRYSATRTPWMQETFLETESDEDTNLFMEEEHALQETEIPEKRELVFASDLEEEEEDNENAHLYDEEDIIGVEDQEVRMEDEESINVGSPVY